MSLEMAGITGSEFVSGCCRLFARSGCSFMSEFIKPGFNRIYDFTIFHSAHMIHRSLYLHVIDGVLFSLLGKRPHADV